MSRVEYPSRIEITCDVCGKSVRRVAATCDICIPQEDFSGAVVAEQKYHFDFCQPYATTVVAEQKYHFDFCQPCATALRIVLNDAAAEIRRGDALREGEGK